MGSVATHQWSPTRSCASLRARNLDAGPSWVLELSGEADIATLALLRQELAHMATMQRACVVVDVTGLAFCDVVSAELIQATRRTRAVTLVGATGTVKRLFDLLDAPQRHRLAPYQAVSRALTEPLEWTPVAG